MRGRDLTSGSIIPISWSLAWPVMLSIFFQTLYQAVDAFWVSRLSEDAIAAVSISQITLFVMISLTIGITVGSGVLMAMSIGRRDIDEAERILGQSFVLNFVAAVIFTTISLLLRRELLTLTGATGTILPLALEYFTITAGGSVLMFVFFAVIFGFNSQGDNRTVTVLFAISTSLNVILDPLLIFGWFGFPALGIRGAALATVISQVVLLAMGLALLAVRDMMVKFRLRNLVFRWHSVRKVFAIGFPAALTNILNPLGLAVLTSIVSSTYREPGAAGLSIGFRIEFFSFLPAIGFGVAALALIGQNLGAGNLERARRAYRVATLAAFTMGTVIGLIVVVFRVFIVGVFASDPVVVGYARSYMITVPFTYGVVAALMVVVMSFQGLGKSWRGFSITAARLGIFVAGTVLVTQLLPSPPIVLVWLSVVVANLVGLALGYSLLQRTFAALPASGSPGSARSAASAGERGIGGPADSPPPAAAAAGAGANAAPDAAASADAAT